MLFLIYLRSTDLNLTLQIVSLCVFFKRNSVAVKTLLKWEEERKRYHGRTVKNKIKWLTQFFLGVINSYLFRIINIITALLTFKEHLFFFDTSQTMSKIRTELTSGEERNTGNSQHVHFRNKMGIREFVGKSEYLNCQRSLWDWILDTVNWKHNLLLHVVEKCQIGKREYFFLLRILYVYKP
jgi:hypothetical protein